MLELELVSFAICPFVQRAVITLLEKGVAFKRTYIELDQPPDWFARLSPTGKVPLLRIGSNEVLFESAVICEYLDETHLPSMHPADALQRARDRAWIEFASSLLVLQYQFSTAPSRDASIPARQALWDGLVRLEAELQHAPFFHGEKFSLIDAAYAPVLQRQAILDSLDGLNPPLAALPALRAWADALQERPSARESVVADFHQRYMAWLGKQHSFLVMRGYPI
jgi:glutathione S-transferase